MSWTEQKAGSDHDGTKAVGEHCGIGPAESPSISPSADASLGNSRSTNQSRVSKSPGPTDAGRISSPMYPTRQNEMRLSRSGWRSLDCKSAPQRENAKKSLD